MSRSFPTLADAGWIVTSTDKRWRSADFSSPPPLVARSARPQLLQHASSGRHVIGSAPQGEASERIDDRIHWPAEVVVTYATDPQNDGSFERLFRAWLLNDADSRSFRPDVRVSSSLVEKVHNVIERFSKS
jgi:hypothetical protein